jgi:hypothetical protein
MALTILRGILTVAAMLVTVVPVAADWVHYDWAWRCEGSRSMNQHRFWVTQSDSPNSPRVQARRITVHLNMQGDRRTQVCEDATHCDWIIEENGLGCRKGCSRADVIFANGVTLATEEQCAQ